MTTELRIAATDPLAVLASDAKRLEELAADQDNLHRRAVIIAARTAVVAAHGRLAADLALLHARAGALPVYDDSPLVVGELHVDRRIRQATLAGQPLKLGPIAFDLLCVLAADPTRIFTKPQLYRAVYQDVLPSGRAGTCRKRTLDSHVTALARPSAACPSFHQASAAASACSHPQHSSSPSTREQPRHQPRKRERGEARPGYGSDPSQLGTLRALWVGDRARRRGGPSM
jgi:hypothetical protein